MEKSGLLVVPASWRDVLKFVSMERGALCVMNSGGLKKPVLPATSWASPILVSHAPVNYVLYCIGLCRAVSIIIMFITSYSLRCMVIGQNILAP